MSVRRGTVNLAGGAELSARRISRGGALDDALDALDELVAPDAPLDFSAVSSRTAAVNVWIFSHSLRRGASRRQRSS